MGDGRQARRTMRRPASATPPAPWLRPTLRCTMAAVVAVALASGCGQAEPVRQAGASTPQASPSQDFPAFWEEFRGAMLANDVARLATMTRFPLDVRGDDDADPVVRSDRDQFQAVLSRVTAQDSGMRAEPETVRQFIERTHTVEATDVEPDGRAARVGDFVFEKAGGTWLLVRVYARQPS